MPSANKFYVYAYLDPRHEGSYLYNVDGKEYNFNFMPRYIGKGWTGECEDGQSYNRAHIHLSTLDRKTAFYDWLKMLLANGFDKKFIKSNCIKIIENNLAEGESFDLESRLIRTIGRKDLGCGCLLNLTDGGGGSANMAVDVRNKISCSRKGKGTGESNVNYGRGDRLRGANNPFYGQKHDDKTRSKMSRWYIASNVKENIDYLVFKHDEFCNEFGLCAGKMYESCTKHRPYRNTWLIKKVNKDEYQQYYRDDQSYVLLTEDS